MLHFEIEATNNCNIRCLHCPHELISRPSGRMSWETFTTVVDKIRAYQQGVRYGMSFSGMGEPLLNPQIYSFVRHVAGEAETAFSSNGSVLTAANVRKLIEAGLDTVYVSFNADEPELFAKMTSGLVFEKILGNVRTALETARGSRLKILANISITKANQHRVAGTRALLEGLGIEPVTTSWCHSRGGFLQDEAVCDTPPLQPRQWSCDVLKTTLFVDWRGRVLICAHDLGGDHVLGDLLTESLAEVLQRRDQLLAAGRAPKICEGCNDVLRVGDTPPLPSGAGGTVRDWLYYMAEPHPEPLSEANEVLRWIRQIYEKRNQSELFLNRLLAIERDVSRDLATAVRDRERLTLERDALIHAQNRLIQERDGLLAERRELAAAHDALLADQAQRREDRERIVGKIDQLQQQLDTRDREFHEVHMAYVAMRQNRLWRLASMLTRDFDRLRRWVSRRPGARSEAGGTTAR